MNLSNRVQSHLLRDSRRNCHQRWVPIQWKPKSCACSAWKVERVFCDSRRQPGAPSSITRSLGQEKINHCQKLPNCWFIDSEKALYRSCKILPSCLCRIWRSGLELLWFLDPLYCTSPYSTLARFLNLSVGHLKPFCSMKACTTLNLSSIQPYLLSSTLVHQLQSPVPSIQSIPKK